MANLAEFRKKYPNAADYSDAELLGYLSESSGRPITEVATDFGVDVGQNNGDFVRNVKGSWENLKGTGAGLVGLAGGLVGADGVKQWGLERAQENFGRAGLYRRESDDFTNIDSLGGAVDWAQGAAGQLTPQLLFGVGTAAAGGAIARRGVSAATRAAIEREVAGTAIMAGTESAAARQLGQQSVNRVLGTAMERGAMAGVAAGSIGQEAGSIYPEMVAEGHDDPLRALGYGVAAGAMDALPEMRAISRVFGGHAPGNMLARAAREGGKQALFEGGTEAGQTAIERNAAYKPLWNDEARKEYINAGAVGAFGGGMMGGVTGAVSRPPITSQKVDLLTGAQPNEQTSLFGDPNKLNPYGPSDAEMTQGASMSAPAEAARIQELMRHAAAAGDMRMFYTLQDELGRLGNIEPPRVRISDDSGQQGSLFNTPLNRERAAAATLRPAPGTTLPSGPTLVAAEHSTSGAAPADNFEPAVTRAAHIVRAGIQAPVALRGNAQFFNDFSNAVTLLGEQLGPKLNGFLVQTTGKDVAHVNQLLAGGLSAPANPSPTVPTSVGTQTAAAPAQPQVPVVKGVAVPPAGESTAPVVKDDAAVTLLKTAGIKATGARVQRTNALIELRDAGALEDGEFDHAVQSLKGNRFGVADEVIRLAKVAQVRKSSPEAQLEYLLGQLTPKERDVLARVSAQEDMADIGKAHGITKDAVSKAHAKIVTKLAKAGEVLGVNPAVVRAYFAVQVSKGVSAENLGGTALTSAAPEAPVAEDAAVEENPELDRGAEMGHDGDDIGDTSIGGMLGVQGMGVAGGTSDMAVRLDAPETAKAQRAQRVGTKLLERAERRAKKAAEVAAAQEAERAEQERMRQEEQARRNAEIIARNEAEDAALESKGELTSRALTTVEDSRVQAARDTYEEGAGGADPKWDDFSAEHKDQLLRLSEALHSGALDDVLFNEGVTRVITAHESSGAVVVARAREQYEGRTGPADPAWEALTPTEQSRAVALYQALESRKYTLAVYDNKLGDLIEAHETAQRDVGQELKDKRSKSLGISEAEVVIEQQIAAVQEHLTAADKALVTQALGRQRWTKHTAKAFLKAYTEWMSTGADAAHRLADIFARFAKAAINTIVAIAVALNFSTVQVQDARAEAIPVTQQTIEHIYTAPRADFQGVAAPTDVRVVADWQARTQRGKPFVIADKVGGLIYAFDEAGTLIAKAPALFGKAPGDVEISDTGAAGLDNMSDAEKITPAGVFPSKITPSRNYGSMMEFKRSADGTAAIAVHRVYLGDPAEKRMDRLNTDTPADNRISYGCINVLPEFYDGVIAKHFDRDSTVVVLPEQQSVESFFPMMSAPSVTTTETTTAENEKTPEELSWGTDAYGLPREGKRTSPPPASTSRRQRGTTQSKEQSNGEGTEGQDAPVDGQGVEGRGSEGSEGGRQVPPEGAGEEEVGLKFSKREEGGGSSADALRSKLQKLFFSRDRFNQRITIVQTEEEAARVSPQFAATYSSKTDKGRTQGFVQGDKIVLIAGNIAPGKELAVFLHEVGVHLGLTNLLTSEQMNQLVDQVAGWAQRDDGSLESRIAKKAHDRVMAAHGGTITDMGGLRAAYEEELIAYFVEEAVLAGVDPLASSSGSTALDQWFRVLWAAAKVALRRIGLGRFDQLTAQNIVDLTFGAARLEITGVWSGFAIKFRNPRDKHVGAGEGTSWESWGHYASQARAVARSYMRDDEGRKRGDNPLGTVLSNGRELSASEVNLLKRADVLLPSAMLDKFYPARLSNAPRKNIKEFIRLCEASLARLRRENNPSATLIAALQKDVADGRALLEGDLLEGLELIPAPAPEGRIYRSDVALDDDRVVQWREPLSEQPEVKAALEQALEYARDYTALARFQHILTDVRAGVLRGGDIIRQLESTFEEMLREGGSALKGLMPDADFKRVQEATYEPHQFAAVAFLRDKAGLQGVRYSTAYDSDKDNVVVWSENRIQRVATQIRGDDEKIRFSKTAPASAAKVDSVVQQALDSPAWATAKHFGRKVNFSLLFGHQLVEKIGVLIPAAKAFFGTLQQKVALRERREEQVLELADKFYRMSTAVQAQANKFLQESTVSQKWGYQPEWDAEAQVDADMAAKFAALPTDAQALVKKVFAYGNETQREYEQVIRDLVDAELSTQVAEAKASKDESRMKALEKERTRLMKERGGLKAMLAGPYAPLVRFGQYVVAVKSPEFRAAEAANDSAAKEKMQSDPAHYTVRFFESMYEAQKAYRAMRAEHGANVDEPVQREPENTHSSELPVQAIKRVQHALESGPDGEKLSANTKRILTRITSDLYIASLDSLSARHSQQRRRNIAGADEDMMRAFVSQGQGMARLLAALETTDALQGSLQDMRSQAREGQRTTEKADALNEVLMRYAAMMDSRPTPIQDKVMATTSTWMLLTNPAYWLSNATQPWMMSLPVLAGRFAFGRAKSALFKSYGKVWSALDGRTFDPSKIKNPVARSADMLKALLDRGHIDLTLEQDLGRFANPGAFGSPAAQWVMSGLRYIPQRVELVNRVATALAAYELEYTQLTSTGMNADLAHDQATEYADSVILDTHGDYSAAGAPRMLMQGGKKLPVKLMGQFRKFQLIQFALIAKVAKQAFSKKMSPEERAVGRASLGWLLGIYGTATGLTGLVGVKTLAFLISAIFGDDDEKDLDLVLTRELGDRTAAQLLLHGVPAAFGMDVSNRLGMGNVTSPFPFADHEPSYRKTYENYLMAATGPFVGGLVPRAASGIDYIRKGEYWKGLELLVPNGVTNAMRAARMAGGGVTNAKGDTLLDPDELEVVTVLFQSVGLPTTQLTERQWKSDALYDTDSRMRDRANTIRLQYAEAAKDQDREAMGELRQEWMDVQEMRKRNGMKPQPLSRLLKVPRDQKEREALADEGVALTKANAGFARSVPN